MQIVFTKKLGLWCLSNGIIVASALLATWLAFLDYLGILGASTRRYGDPALWMMFLTGVALLGLVLLIFWLVRYPKTISLDVAQNTLMLGNVSKSLPDTVSFHITSHSYDNLKWFGLRCKVGKVTVLKLPVGFEANTNYPELLSYLEQRNRPFELQHAHWFTNQQQRDEDKALNERGKAFLKSKDDKNNDV
ncbi:hypothetical protein [Alkalimonas amylolytica]|uniref:Uncharacterized protein n=1 Tax=Alkalimonas amylolytica TaxID=152573 RepID=A0A1H3X0Q4_ALKAM|nr:hypothetical protein [Alkalimonas amylolytica]SDZ92823.1 hypothetical protein SAMN04488051_10147 [Alkalimonas amylolytica]